MHRVIVIFAVEDVERSTAFYRQVFSWPTRVSTPVYVELEITDALGLGLYERASFGKNIGATPPPASGDLSLTELYVYVDSMEDALARLDMAGARCLSGRALRPWGDEAAYYADPEGNVIATAIRHSS
jgi:catechol 2,3-dioxygenase-like lactoylglutathione lyase family enzyme